MPDKAEPASGRRQRSEQANRSAPRHSATGKASEEAKTASIATDLAAAAQDLENYRPKLGRIREEKEREKDSAQESKRSTSRSQSRERTRERSTRRRIVPTEDVGINSGHVYRRGVRHRSGQSTQLQRQLTSLANASVLSVLSSLTAASSASSGSNSTITQKRYDSGQGSRRRRRRSGQRDSEGEESSSSKKSSSSTQKQRANMDEHHLSHSYPAGGMVSYAPPHWQPQLRPHSSTGYQNSSRGDGMGYAPTKSRGTPSTSMDRTNSDSGISMREQSPEAVEKLSKMSPVVRHDSVLDQGDVKKMDEEQEQSDDSSDEDEGDPPIDVSQYQVTSHDEDRHLREQLLERQGEASSHILQSPQPRRYTSFTRPRYDVQPGVQHMPYQDLYHPQAYAPRRGSMVGSQVGVPPGAYSYPQSVAGGPFAYIEDEPSRETVVGYELLARKLVQSGDGNTKASDGTSTIVPLYRRFDFLGHRVLLQLQDDLAELEEELRRTDEMIARQQGQYQMEHEHSSTSPSDENDSTVKPQRAPSSRREEANSDDELCVRRSNILGRIYIRLKQYNKALASYRASTTGFDVASEADVQRYRAWMDVYKPVVDVEAKFLDFKDDLVSITSQRPRPDDTPSQAGPVVGGVSGRKRLAALATLACVQMMLFAVAPNMVALALLVVGSVLSNGLLYVCLQAS